MFARQLTQTARIARPIAVRQARFYSAKPGARPTGLRGLWAQVPVEAYPLVGIVSFVCCVGVYAGFHAMTKEKENFFEHKSTGNTSVKY
ncbi:hypothetical protein DACRYDRAFT_25428 [Dacryopinax primogenitus]|uniref:Uncharacterized protein n=1 Tax=Dacryopinax primogenitus (strain DJM 731) TaxID=1858805 RepID=M5FZT0_DACPD|nr:uncharacterized protein DACRYDRAFT_25428 [Dacryopinax primogenitus]EJT97017.1 hypothetical protein DACRYDRAFT_25428 [Dacryopinax primogenitus]